MELLLISVMFYFTRSTLYELNFMDYGNYVTA